MRSRFRHRWERYFGSDPGFATIAHLYEEVVSEYDDGGEGERALDLSYYERARSLGLDTSQHCPECKQQIDQVETIHLEYGECFVCEARHDNEHEEQAEDEAERKRAHEAWRMSLSPEERTAYDQREYESYKMMMYGLIARDVQ